MRRFLLLGRVAWEGVVRPRGNISLLQSEKISGKFGETLFIDRFFRSSNHSLPSSVKFLIKTVIGEESRGLPETRDLELSVSIVVMLVLSSPSFAILSVGGVQFFQLVECNPSVLCPLRLLWMVQVPL